jgi:hypothetical protein
MHHARRLARLHHAVVPPFDAPDDTRHTIIEVYPALSKMPKDTCCYSPIQRLLPPNSLAGTDECDACICALMALAFGANGSHRDLPLLTGPEAGTSLPPHEGWIYYPPYSWLSAAA